jgi:hypothetical protein
MNDYQYDGLLEDILAGNFKPDKKKSAGLAKSVETIPIIKPLFETQKKLSFTEETKTFQFQIKENGSKLDHAVAYVNGIQVADYNLEESHKDVDFDEDEKGVKTYKVASSARRRTTSR